MDMIIGTNVASITAQNHLESSRADMETSMERLFSGKRINSAMDDAASLAIAGRMSAQVEGMNLAVRNANDGVSMLQTAEGGLEETTDLLLRMRELAVQSSSGTYNATDRAALDSEFDALKAEITQISDRTDFNGTSVLNSSATVDIQVGTDTGDTIPFTFKDMDAAAIGSGVATTPIVESTASSSSYNDGSTDVQVYTTSRWVVAGESASITINGNTYTQEFLDLGNSALVDSEDTWRALGDKVVAGEGGAQSFIVSGNAFNLRVWGTAGLALGVATITRWHHIWRCGWR